jgi:hypothetical protein
MAAYSGQPQGVADSYAQDLRVRVSGTVMTNCPYMWRLEW